MAVSNEPTSCAKGSAKAQPPQTNRGRAHPEVRVEVADCAERLGAVSTGMFASWRLVKPLVDLQVVSPGEALATLLRPSPSDHQTSRAGIPHQ